MPDTGALTSVVSNQLPPRTTTSHRWPRKWATLGGRGAPSTSIPPINLNDPEFSEKTNGHHMNGNGHHHHRYSTSLFRKSSTISRTNGGTTINNSDLNTETPSLKKSRSLINVLRSKLNSPAVLRRFRTKSRENLKSTITEVNNENKIEEEKVSLNMNDNNKKNRKRDPSPMKRFTSRLAQLTRSSTHSSIETEQHKRKSLSSSPPPQQQKPTTHPKDEVDHINACYDEIRAKYFDKNNNNNNNTKKNTMPNPPNERLKDLLSTTTASSVEYYDRPYSTNGDIHNRSLSTISMNGSLLSHDFLNNSQQYAPSSPPKTSDDPLLNARKQSNIKLNCMLSGYGFTTPFGNNEKILGQHDLFKFHHYHDVGKRKFDFNFTNNNNRMYSSLRTRPMSRSIDSFRRATTTIENEIIPTSLTVEPNNSLFTDDDIKTNVPCDNELVIREDGDIIESEAKVYSSKVHVTPAASFHVKTFISTSSSVPDDVCNLSNGKSYDERNDQFERNFLRAVDRALGVANINDNHLLQPVYDIPMKVDESDMDIIDITERALSTFNHANIPMDNEPKSDQIDDEEQTNGTESPNVELFDRTGEVFDTENIQWQSSAVYDDQTMIDNCEQEKLINNYNENNMVNDHVWSLVDDLTRKTHEFLLDEPQNGREFLAILDNEEHVIKSKADSYNKLLQTDDNRLNEDVRSDINAAVGEVNLLLRGKLKQFRGLCQANVAKSTTSAGEPTPLDSDLEGFWDITYPLIDKVKVKFTKLDVRKAKQWACIEDEYDPNDVNNRPRIIDERLKQLQPHPNKSSKPTTTKAANDDLKKLIQERRKAAANLSNTTNQNHDVEIYVTHK